MAADTARTKVLLPALGKPNKPTSANSFISKRISRSSPSLPVPAFRGARFNELLKSLESIAFNKLDERLIKYLKNKTKVSGKSSIQLSHNQIAEEMGTSRVVISRLLKQLENDKKLVLYRNEIKLLSGF